MIFINKGPYTMVLDGEHQTFQSGDLVVIFPNVIHSYDNSNDDSETTGIICNREYFGEASTTFLNFVPKQHFIRAELVHTDVKLAINSLLLEVKLDNKNISALKSLLQLIFARIIPQLNLEQDKNITSTNMTSKIITYVSENYKDNISLDLISSKLGISKSYVSQIFSKKIKVSLTDYVNSQRVENAKRLLKTEDNLSILQISESCGFDTQRTFNRVFSKFCGMTPREFRQDK